MERCRNIFSKRRNPVRVGPHAIGVLSGTDRLLSESFYLSCALYLYRRPGNASGHHPGMAYLLKRQVRKITNSSSRKGSGFFRVSIGHGLDTMHRLILWLVLKNTTK